MISSASPLPIACAAMPIALSPEPHNGLTAPGTCSGKPARSTAMRATLRLSSPAWLAAKDVCKNLSNETDR